jgi:hypothetical protein
MPYAYDGSLETTLSAAVSHHRDAGEAIDDLPDRDDNPEEHAKAIRAFHGHLKMASEYAERYRAASGLDDDHDVSTGGDPEAGSSPEERRRRAQRLRAQIAGV